MSKHTEHAAQLAKLGISHRAAARDLGVAASTFSNYMTNGKLAGNLETGDFVGRLQRYIGLKAAGAKTAAPAYMAPQIAGKFSNLGMSLAKLSDGTGVDYATLKRGIYNGRWPDEITYKLVTAWIERTLEEKKEGRMLTKISLSEEVLEHFGLDRDPFTNEMESSEDIFDTKELSRAEKKVMVAVEKSGWVAVTGEIGSGKSTLIKRVKARLAKKREVMIVEPRTIEKQFLGASHVCDSILNDLGTSGVLTRHTLEAKARVVGRTLEEAFRDGKKVVILIDEAHLLRDDALLALKRIYEFEVGFKKLLAIVLVGQGSLARRLRTNFLLAEVSQRVDLYELGSLNGALGSYIHYKIDRAGAGNKEIFDASAVRAIGEKADTPLAVNNVAAAALIAAWDAGEKKVTAAAVKAI